MTLAEGEGDARRAGEAEAPVVAQPLEDEELHRGEAVEEEEDDEDVEERAVAAARRARDKKTRFEVDEHAASGLTDTTSLDFMDDDQSEHRSMPDLKYQMLERKIERLEQRLEAYEGMQRKLSKGRATDGDATTTSSGSETHQLIEFFLSEMDKQNAVIAQMRANTRVLERKLEDSFQKTHKFHREQLQRMTKFQEVVQMMNEEYMHGSMLREEEKALEKSHHDRKTKAVRRALDEQINDLKSETAHQRRRLEIKFEKKIVDLASENQLLKAENLELRDEINKLAMTARSNKRTMRILSDEVIKLKRAVGAPPNPEVEEALRLSSIKTSPLEVSV